MKNTKGCFLTFEGIEGSGKSTHAKHAAQYLKRKGHSVLLIREPGGTSISEKIRTILLDKKNTKMAVQTELLLYNAARAQLVSEVIKPALAKEKIVICDRFYDSTIAYQCFGGKLARASADRMNQFAAQGVRPFKTFLLDSDVERGLARAGRGDRMELKSLTFHKHVRKGFLKLAEQEKRRFFVIEEMPIPEGRRIIEKILDGLFK